MPSTASSSTRQSSTLPNVNIEALLQSLNSPQLQAVKHDPRVPLQILAGPGSGKTKVLTSRIAHLILVHSIDPSSICAVTFTNKAANEMRERLTKLIGKERTNALKMGTFHSICARFLRMHSQSVDLETNFTICDADESKKLVAALMKPYKEYMIAMDIAFTEGTVSSVISKAKAKGHTASMHFAEMEKEEKLKKRRNPGALANVPEGKSLERIVAEIYAGYEEILKQNNALDFDDLLVYGVRLFTQHHESVLWCKHILVDEFQDTNTMQYELMCAIAIRKCVTIVGDPDQSIYGWRSAEVINLAKMRRKFTNTKQIFLEQNYRSTAAILRACLAIVEEDKTRIPKSLHTSHPLGATPVLGVYPDEKQEADFIAYEIKRCVANMGGILKWGDFVILLRFNALSRPIESALQKQGIPCRILGGHKFFERMEIKDLLAYLQLVDNASFNPAFVRAVKAPSRGMGDKTLAELAAQADKLKISQLDVAEGIYDGKLSDIKPPIKRKTASFVEAIRLLRKSDAEKTLPSDLIRKLIDLIKYEDHLRKTQQDWESRWENVKELITFASEVETEFSAASPQSVPGSEKSDGSDSMLRQFLQSSMLSSEGDNKTEEESKEKVTLSTCHAAKGLEWPVVMIPSVDQDTFPFYRSEDLEEERRLLYVACTRAQSLLYVLYSTKRVVAGKAKDKKLSLFVSAPRGKNEGLFSHEVPRFLPSDRSVISGVLGRPLPDETEVARRIAELEEAGDQVQPVYQDVHGGFSAIPLTGAPRYAPGNSMIPLNAAAIYPASDVLATLSASFMKDHRRAPFRQSKPSNPAAQPLPTPNFAPVPIFRPSAKEGATWLPSQLPTSSYSPWASSPIAPGPSSSSGYSSASPITSSERINVHKSSLIQASSRTIVNDHSNPQSDRAASSSTATLPVPSRHRCPDVVDSLPQYSASLLGDMSDGAPSPRVGTSRSSTKRPAVPSSRGVNDPPSVHKAQQPSQRHCPYPSSYDQNRPPREFSSRPITAVPPKPSPGREHRTTKLLDHYDTTLKKAVPPSTAEIPPKVSHQRVPISQLPPATTVSPLHQTPIIPQTSQTRQENPTISVKRRLGMGRGGAGYSNKKFKPPV